MNGVDAVGGLGSILGVWAHPDDETYLSAGIMAAAASLGARVACVTATRGELGTPDPLTWPPERLAAIRTAELDRALEILGVGEHHWLDYPDGGCDAVPADEAAARIGALIDALRPDTILTFGPEGMTGHTDHRTVSAWVDVAAGLAAHRPRILHATTTPEWRDTYAADLDDLDVFAPGTPPVTPAAELALHLVLPPDLLERKVAALEAQESQTAALVELLGAQRYRAQLVDEMFRLAG